MATESITLTDIIEYLFLEAGRLMEDTSVELSLRMPVDRDDRRARLELVRQAADDITALSAAAEVLDRRGGAQS